METHKLSGKYAIAGLGMVVGVPEKELEKRQAEVPGHPMLEHAIPSPVLDLSAKDLEAEAARRAIEDAGLTNKDIDGAVHVHGGPRSGRGVIEHMDAFPRMLGLPVNFYYHCGRGGGWSTIGIITALSFLRIGPRKIRRHRRLARRLDEKPQKRRSRARGARPDKSRDRCRHVGADFWPDRGGA